MHRRLSPVAALVLLTMGCTVEPPPPFALDGGTPGNRPYPNVGRCTLAGTAQRCPGVSCGANATGPPDNVTVNLRQCGTLDVVFTAGTVLSRVGTPDLEVVLGAPLPTGVSVRVEGSAEGNEYVIIGFLGSPPSGTHVKCKAEVAGTRARIDASFCNLISNVNFVRFSEERPGTGDVVIDAVEALSFRVKDPG